MAPEALAVRVTAGVLACCCFAIACSRAAPDVAVTWKIEPSPPVTDAATLVRFTIQNGSGRQVRGATLRLEAHMPHPGMAPVTSEVHERDGGIYEARLHLTMAGDWVLVMSGQLTDGSRISKEIKVQAVRSAGC